MSLIQEPLVESLEPKNTGPVPACAHGDPPPGCAHATPPALKSMWGRVGFFLLAFLAAYAGASFMTAGIIMTLSSDRLDMPVAAFVSRHLVPLTIASTLAGILVTVFFWIRIDRRPLAALGIPRHPGVPGEIFRGSLAAVWLMTLAALPALIIHRESIRFLPDGLGPFLLNLLPYGVTFAVVALNEELAFRGYLFMNLILRLKPWIAVVITSAVFAAMHAVNPNITPLAWLNIFLAGSLFTLSFLKWGSLWYAIGFHFAWNLYQAVVLTLPVSGVRIGGLLEVPTSGPAWLTGGEFGPEGSIPATLLLVAACSRMATGLPVEMNRTPVPPPCATGEACPVVPQEIAAAARRGMAGKL